MQSVITYVTGQIDFRLILIQPRLILNFLYLGQVALEDKTVYLCQKSVKICHYNEKPSATGLFTKGQNLVADGQTSKMPSTTSGAGQIETNFGKQ